ncbi:MAG: flagellar biosynthesis protein FliQ [Deltaproteobacteria bacterium]|nr:flagellar biosynthesis protein FliQ [Deltaproteobacteria bacterium]
MPNADFFIEAASKALWLTLLLSAGPVLAAMVVGLVISILQATTQIQEQTLTFVPKLVVIGAALAFLGPDILQKMITFTGELFTRFPLITR